MPRHMLSARAAKRERRAATTRHSCLLVGISLLVAACGGVAQSAAPPSAAPSSEASTLPSSAAPSGDASPPPLVRSFEGLPFRFDLPDGWMFGSEEERTAWLEDVRRTHPDWAARYEAVLDTAPSISSAFVAYDMTSNETVLPSVSCNTLDRGSTPVDVVLQEGERQNLEGIAKLPDTVGEPKADRVELPAGEAVRIRWRWTGPAGEDAASIGYLFVVGPTTYTCVFSSTASTVAAHEPAWEAILGTLEADPAWSVAATIPVGVKPFQITGGAGDIWVASTESGTIERISPATNEVVATIDLRAGRPTGEREGPFGIAAAADRIWVTSIVMNGAGESVDGFAWVIDPVSNAVTSTGPVGRTPLSIAEGFGSTWVANLDDDTVSRLDAATYDVVATIPVGAQPTVVTAGAGSIWVANAGGTVSRIDPTRDEVVATIDVGPEARAVTAASPGIWVATNDGVHLVDAATNTVAETLALGGINGLAAEDGAVWASDGMGVKVRRIEEATAEITDVVSLSTNSWGITLLDGSVWVVQPAAADKKWAEVAPGTVTRIDR